MTLAEARERLAERREVAGLRRQVDAVRWLADQLDREARAPGQYAEIRRSHAKRIRHALEENQ